MYTGSAGGGGDGGGMHCQTLGYRYTLAVYADTLPPLMLNKDGTKMGIVMIPP
jgi:hypothetical protein